MTDQEQSVSTFNLFSGDQRQGSPQGNTSWNVHLQKVSIADHIQSVDQTVIVSDYGICNFTVKK